MTRVLVDGVFFQISNSGIARVWRSVLAILAKDPRFQVYFLDRGNAPEIYGIEYVPFPTHDAANGPADSLLIQAVCDHYSIDVFTSTYYTSPVSTPMLLMVYDMIPELFGFDMAHCVWLEKTTTICYAQRYLCISSSTRRDLLALYPEIPFGSASVAHCGVDTEVFYPRAAKAIDAFRLARALDRPYFLFVGSRVQHNGYKNSRLFFDALRTLEQASFDVFCVGGEPHIEQSILDCLPVGVRCLRANLTDEELALAYGGALALVYPSLYEGFGMPVIEAMASGCPVITTCHGSLAEAAGDAALQIDGVSVDEMCSALMAMQGSQTRNALRTRGLAHAQQFRWSIMAGQLMSDLNTLVKEAGAGDYEEFLAEWSRLRIMQGNVDYRQ
jgi:glycosyltransferase involved in cell wall biosynthesis